MRRSLVRPLLPLALVFASLLATACDGPINIVHSLSELEANEILVVLDSQGISGQKVKEDGRIVTWAVAVPGSRQKDALRILVANKLPKARSSGLKEVYPADGGGLIPTKTEEKAKFLITKCG